MLRAASVALLLASLPRVALAWTEAQVETVHAHVEFDSQAHAVVDLDLRIRVRAGWLEGLEVAGLDPELVLDAQPIVLRSDANERFAPQVRVRPGEHATRIGFRFERRNAPRRGHYRMTVRYEVDLSRRAAPSGEFVRVEWTLPGWRTGLDGVVVELVGPGEGQATDDDVTETNSIERTVERLDGRTQVRWRRAHLPRTLPWTVALEVPREEMPSFGEAADVDVPSQPGPAAVAESRDSSIPIGAALLALLCLAVTVAFERECRRRGAIARPWIPLGARWRSLLGLALGATAAGMALFGEYEAMAGALLGALLLAGQRKARGRALRLGAWRQAKSDDLARAAKQADRHTWLMHLDATRALGVVTWAACAFVLAAVVNEPTAVTMWLYAALPLPLFVATGSRLPWSPQRRLRRMERLARTMQVRLPAPAMMLALHEAADGQWQDARLRIVTETRPVGLVRLDVAIDADGAARGLVLTREGSEAESKALAIFGPTPLRGPGGRLVRVLRVDEALAAALLFGRREKKRKQKPRRKTRAVPRTASEARPASLH